MIEITNVVKVDSRDDYLDKDMREMHLFELYIRTST